MRRLFWVFCLSVFASAAGATSQPVALTEAQQQVTAALGRLDGTLKKAALELGKTGLTGDDARRVLAAACGEMGSAVDCATVDLQGRLTTVEPAPYRGFEGKDISAQEQVKRLQKTHKPVLSAVFRSVEGYDAVDAEYPVLGPDGSLLGSVSVMFKPEVFLGALFQPLIKGVPVDLWAMEKGGRLLYDSDPAQVGLNLFTSPVYQPYKALVSLARKIAKSATGEGTYRFKDQTLIGVEVNKKAYWQTASLYGTAWRLVGIHREQAATGKGRVSPAAATVDQALEKFAGEAALQAALADGRKDKALPHFQRFYEATPGIYSVQWIDANGVNRFGFPAENSLSDYNYPSGTAPNDAEILQLCRKQQGGVLESPLFEGRVGSFVFKPVFNDGRYLGLVYTIKLK